ncbi:MAG: hypothetical protein U0441_10995 [Polyangiaceae bacterium]
MNKPSPRLGTSARHGLSWLLLGAASLVACAGSNSPDDGAHAPTWTGDATGSAAATTATAPATADVPVTTAAPVVTAAPTAEPTAAPTSVATAAPTATAASGPAGANLHVGSMSVDGLTVEDLACRAEGLGILGSMLVVGGLSKKKAALDACGKGKVQVTWVASKGTITTVTAKADNNAKMEACVAKVLKGTQAPFEGECAATVTLGK